MLPRVRHSGELDGSSPSVSKHTSSTFIDVSNGLKPGDSKKTLLGLATLLRYPPQDVNRQFGKIVIGAGFAILMVRYISGGF
jgi:hypothetical protein